jgi:hypothetical protein
VSATDKWWGKPLTEGLQQYVYMVFESEPDKNFTTADVAAILEAPKNSISGVVSTLVIEGWLARVSEGTYCLAAEKPVEDKSRMHVPDRRVGEAPTRPSRARGERRPTVWRLDQEYTVRCVAYDKATNPIIRTPDGKLFRLVQL